MTITLYEDRKGIQLDEVSVELKHGTCESKAQKIDFNSLANHA